MSQGNSQKTFIPRTPAHIRRTKGIVQPFWISSLIAIVPYVLGVAWLISDGLKITVFFHGVPDIALAAVVLAVAAYCNTLFSFVKLEGWQRAGRWTLIHAVAVALLSLLAFVQYLKGAYAPSSSHNPNILFFTSLILFVATGMFAWALQHAFVSDECRYARDLRRQLIAPPEPP